MEKVRLPKVVIEAIELLRAKGMPLHEIGIKKATSNLPDVNGWTAIMAIPTDTLFRALYYGYEVDMTPEEKVRELYKEAKYNAEHAHESIQWWQGRFVTIVDMLDALGIKIPGVNAE